MSDLVNLDFRWASEDTWQDVEFLFGKNGACGGCWCMHWKLKKSLFDRTKGDGNKQLLQGAILSGVEPGIVAYADGSPIAWCAVEPRKNFPTLARSRILKPLDDSPVWSVVCFFVLKNFRQKGVSTEMLKAVVKLCRDKGVKIVEGYPVEPKKGKIADAFVWTGLASSYEKAGFTEVARRSETRPIMRYIILDE